MRGDEAENTRGELTLHVSQDTFSLVRGYYEELMTVFFWSKSYILILVISVNYKNVFFFFENSTSIYVFFQFLNYFIVVQLQLSAFLPTPANPTSLPCFYPPPWFCPCVLYSSSWKPFSPLSFSPSPLAIIRLFLTSRILF